MNEIKKILVALTLTEQSKHKFNFAGKLATALGADLTVANIINSRDVEAVEKIVSLGYEVDGEHYVQGVMNERRQFLDQIIAEYPFPLVNLRAIFRVGNPFEELLKIISEEEIDMVVMGPKGRTNLEYILIGSVAEKLFRRSPVTVVSYRSKKDSERLKISHTA